MKVYEVMSKNPLTVSPETKIKEVYDLFDKVSYWSVYITKSQRLVGIVTRNDLKNRSDKAHFSDPISKIMSTTVFQIDKNGTIESAISRLDRYGITSLAVVDGDRLCGIITRGDINRKYYKKNVAYDTPSSYSPTNQIKIKKPTVAIIILIILAFSAFFLLPNFIRLGIPNPLEKTCSDKTISGLCSINKPYKCIHGNLIYDALSCGCYEGEIVDNAACRSLRSCSDGTQHNNCSVNKPNFCNDGNLTQNPVHCGCPQGFRNYNNSCIHEVRCTDGTFAPECSTNKPYLCQNGTLIEKSSLCGCPSDTIQNGDSCVDKLMTAPEVREFTFTLRGQNYIGNITIFGGLNNYLQTQDGFTYWSYAGANPSDKEVETRIASQVINQPNQDRLIANLIDTIKATTSNKDDQARIAISLVQNIPYDYASANANLPNSKYPYQVLYSARGVCGEKSKLLALLLKKLDYGVVLFYYPTQNHEAVGIKCPNQYSLGNSGYCFVESTSPSIITNSEGEYVGVGKLTSTPLIIEINDGDSFDSVSEEYSDARRWIVINEYAESNRNILDQTTYTEWLNLMQKYGMKTNS